MPKLPLSPASAFKQTLLKAAGSSADVPDAPIDIPSPVEVVSSLSPAAAVAGANILSADGLFDFDLLDPLEKFFDKLWSRLVFVIETLGGLGVFAVMLVVIGLLRNPQVIALLAL